MSNKWILSATEIDTFGTCQRKWAYVYLDGIKPTPSKAAQLGSAVHQVLQEYLITNSIDYQTQEGRIANSGLSFLPEKLPEANVEKPIFFMHGDSIFHGYIDFYENIGSQKWLIGDHKTCASFTTALTPAGLKTNTQANIYAQWAFKELGAETVNLRWIYYRTKGKPEARVVETEIKKDEASELFETHLQTASEIKRIAQKRPHSLELPKNLDACYKYGPCPFLSSCRVNQGAEPTRGKISTEEMLILSEHYSPKAPDAQSTGRKESFHLFVDCTPTKIEIPYQKVIELSELLKPVQKKIQQEKNLAHYRLAGYGQHVGLMAHYLEEHIKETNYNESTAILSSSKTPEGIDTLQTLTAAASVVVRGF